jgi:tRNA nucleotidyltransferase/poly(A) polymerase
MSDADVFIRMQDIPPAVMDIYSTLRNAGYEAYFVGGCVRNLALSIQPKDWDITTLATPEQMLSLFHDGFYDNAFGTVGVPIQIDDTKHVVEITTFRTERNYTDGRHPGEVSWGNSIYEDLDRRDFTMNAMAFTVEQETIQFVDPHHGLDDLRAGIIRAVGDPTKRFKEDALRLMRAIRFATQLQCTIEDTTWNAIRDDAVLLPMIATERVRDELLTLLASDYPYEGVMLLQNAGLLVHILPELLEGQGLSQARPGRHHIYDVYTHNLLSLKYCPSVDPITRFATLIHDIGKSRVAGVDENGLVIFYNHEIAGARMAYDLCNRLHFSKKDREKIVSLIRWHMFSVDEHQTDAAVRRFIRRVGIDRVADIIDLRIGDRLGSGIPAHRAESWRLKQFKERIAKELGPKPFSLNDLAINGTDIMKELGLTPGPHIGTLLNALFEEVDEDLSKNTREYLLSRLKQLAS